MLLITSLLIPAILRALVEGKLEKREFAGLPERESADDPENFSGHLSIYFIKLKHVPLI